MKLLALALTLPLLISCKSSRLTEEQRNTLNSSSLYNPSVVTTIKGQEYQFEEGVLIGDGTKFINNYEYTKKVIQGK